MMPKAIRFVRSLLATILIGISTAFHVLPLLVVALAKAVVRIAPVRRWCDYLLMRLAESWIGLNSWMIDHLTDTRIVVEGMPEAGMEGNYLVISNHQSWVDIPVLQKLFNRRLPLLRFFLKSQLIWVPLLGLAWWALDFPFMKRYSKATLAKRPELAGRDIDATRRACRKFADIPVSVMNFVEGTRFTPAKHAAQDSPYRHLLKPRAGGVAFVLDAMGDTIDTLVDVTISYCGPAPGLPDLFANKVREIRVSVRTLPLSAAPKGGDYTSDADYRERFQQWINDLWREKDATMARLRTHACPSPSRDARPGSS
ncbi:MAG: acyltransferase [Xanthomonadales bacterium]|nr:acyltransferase [Xanthomonadales bacterium]